MKTGFLALSALASLAATFATPVVVERAISDVNPYLGKEVFLSPKYSASVAAQVEAFKAAGKLDLAAQATKVGQVPTFIWISSTKDVATIAPILRQAKAVQVKTGKKQRKFHATLFAVAS
jgi:cellulose 1,4-beta-cellobiosidase